MKAVVANFSLGREAWDRLKARFLRRDGGTHPLSLQLMQLPEPANPGPGWVKVRSIMSGISDLDEGMFLHGDLSALGAFLSFPFVPGNENLGIVTEVGEGVQGIELGERVVVNPLLSCKPRGVNPPCPSCASGNPSACRSFGIGLPEPGVIIGACRATGGGWADSFIAHRSQVRTVPPGMESDLAIMIPEFVRALRAVMQHPPEAGQRVIVVGARSLGLLTLLALKMLGHSPTILVVAEQAAEADMARRLAQCEVVLSVGPATAYEDVAAFVKGSVRYPEVGRITMSGGADLVYETTGVRENVEDAFRFTGEGNKTVLMGMNQASGFDMSPLWFKNVRVHGTAFSGVDSYKGELRETMDIALDLVSSHGLPAGDLITNRFKLEDHSAALAALQDRSTSKAIKVIFQHVM